LKPVLAIDKQGFATTIGARVATEDFSGTSR
jgi:hypothetical protein